MGKMQNIFITICFIVFILSLGFFIVSLNKYNEILKNQTTICEQCKQTIFRCNALESQYKELIELIPETDKGLYIKKSDSVEDAQKTLKEIFTNDR